MTKQVESKDVAVVDIGVSNIASVTNAIFELGFNPTVVQDPKCIFEFDRLILPGNGSFRIASERLKRSGWIDQIKKFATSKKPILGICLGMQMMATLGEEDGISEGLDLIPGVSKKIDSVGRRLPHVGWNTVTQSKKHFIFDKIKPSRDFYFCHSFVFQSTELGDCVANTTYGSTFGSVVGRGNVIGVQFHPEKSQRNGLQILSNFMTWDGSANKC